MAIRFVNRTFLLYGLLGLSLILGCKVAVADSDDLKNSASPYIAMHAGDEIQWQMWNKETLLKSKKENKPIFLSLGYFSCYWCHVFQRESFNNVKIAHLINTYFIPVVVDRELQSSLDAYLMRFAEETLGQGGWPLNVVITPDGYPLIATLYLPPENFNRWLKRISQLWSKDSDKIRVVAKEAAEEMIISTTQQSSKITPKLQAEIELAFLKEVMSVADEFEGGFGDQAKFPLPAILQSLLNIYEKNNNEQLGEFLLLTLNSIRDKGLYDHLDGGYFRYTADPSWQIPHFEKMLYDNAQIASLYLHAGKIFHNDYFTQAGVQQLDYLIENFGNDRLGYYSSYSAIDDAGVEGGYYLWREKEIVDILTPREIQVTNLMWGWDQPKILEEGRFPVPVSFNAEALKKLTLRDDASSVLQRLKKKLKANRDKRILPRDNKMLASWNALMLIALVDGAQITGKERFKNAASSLAKFISTKLIVNGQLFRSLNKGQLSGNADLEDYAYTAEALYRWSKISESNIALEYKTLSLQLARNAWKRFWRKNGWKISDTMLIPNLSLESMIVDGPLPSASAILIGLGFELGDKNLLTQSKNALGFGHNYLKTSPFWYASHVELILSKLNK